MGRLALAFKMFFRILADAETAEKVQSAVAGDSPQALPEEKPAPIPQPVVSARSDALTLLETLQREARLIDFLQEDLSGYQDAQVGAAVREVHRGCQDVLKRCFEVSSTVDAEEETQFEVTVESNPAEVRLVGNVVNARPVTGTLVHSGWKARKCELPKWNGDSTAEKIIAPAEVEIR